MSTIEPDAPGGKAAQDARPASPSPGAGPEPEEGGGGLRSIIILVVVVLVVAGAVWMAQRLRSAGQVQDCVMAGRSNCGNGR